MKVIVAGHEYEVSNPGGKKVISTIYFVNKKVKKNKLELVHDGTTTEEVLKVVIDRIEHLDNLLPSKENKTAVKNLKLALAALEKRTADRLVREVEGTNTA